MMIKKIEIPSQVEVYSPPESLPMTKAQTLGYIREGHGALIDMKIKEKGEIKLDNELSDAQRVSKIKINLYVI